jgi:hypothetical protein
VDNGSTYYLLSLSNGNILPNAYQNVQKGPHPRLCGYNREISILFNKPEHKIKYEQKQAEVINLGNIVNGIDHQMDDDKIFIYLYNYLFKNSKRTISKYNRAMSLLPKLLAMLKNKNKSNKDVMLEFNYSDGI